MAASDYAEAFRIDAVRRLMDAYMLEIVTAPDPVAGTEWSITVPGGEYWELVAVQATLVSSATAASRVASIFLDSGSGVGIRLTGDRVQTSVQTMIYTFGEGLGFNGASGTVSQNGIPLRGLALQPGWKIRSLTSLLQVGDDWGAPTAFVRKISAYNLTLYANMLSDELASYE